MFTVNYMSVQSTCIRCTHTHIRYKLLGYSAASAANQKLPHDVYIRQDSSHHYRMYSMLTACGTLGTTLLNGNIRITELILALPTLS